MVIMTIDFATRFHRHTSCRSSLTSEYSDERVWRNRHSRDRERTITEAYVGIDVSFTKTKRLPVCVATKLDGRLTPFPLKELPVKPPTGAGNRGALSDEKILEFAKNAAEYLVDVSELLGVKIRRIALDAPRQYKHELEKWRACEGAMYERNISCFATPSETEFDRIIAKASTHLNEGKPLSRLPHANQMWMRVGFALFAELQQYECLEVFPQATVKLLCPDAGYKTQQAGLLAQSRAVSAITGWPDSPSWLDDIAYGSRHDKLDAYLCAWIASMDEVDREPLGELPNDVIWVPRLPHATS